jgi:hypothetical protein
MFSFFKRKVPRIGTTKIFLTNKEDFKNEKHKTYGSHPYGGNTYRAYDGFCSNIIYNNK